MARTNCPECGAEVLDRSKPCPKCGVGLPMEAKKGMPAWALVLVIVCVAVPVLIVTLGILGTLIVPNVIARLDHALAAKAAMDVRTIAIALDSYAQANGGVYPESLDRLIVSDANGLRHFEETLPGDPWKRAYVYLPPSEEEPRPRVLCYGHDGEPGGEGRDADVDSWALD